MLSIGEFSKLTGLTVKTLRFYHEKGMLIPAWVDDKTGYRYYDFRQLDKARVITQLRTLEFSLEQINEMMAASDDEADMVCFLERQEKTLLEKVRDHQAIVNALELIIQREREARTIMENSTFQVEEKRLESQLIAGVRMKGRYSDCGKGFSKIGKAFWRHISGKCFLLHHDSEFKAGDADFEACMPIRKAVQVDGITVTELPGGHCVSLLHKGPYEELGRSYAKITAYVKDHGYKVLMPTREIYIKGPGMIFKGNPKKYLTEIQMLIE